MPSGQTIAPRTVIGFKKNGAPIYAIAGGSGEGDGGAGGSTGGDAGGAGGSEGGSAGGDGGDGGGPDGVTVTAYAGGQPVDGVKSTGRQEPQQQQQGGAAAGDGGAKPTEPAKPAGKEPAGESGKDDGKSLDELPPWAQKVIKGLQKSDGDNRVRAKKAEEASTETAQKFEAFTQALSAALGGKPVGEQDEPPSAEELTAALATANDSNRQAAVRLAVWESGSEIANVPELMDSAKFLSSIQGLDPAADEFADQLTEKITAAVESNPQRFRASAPRAGAGSAPSGGDFSGGTGTGQPKDPESMSVDEHRTDYSSSRPR